MIAATLLTFARKVDYAYERSCGPLLEKFDLPQVSFDILLFLANNPEYKTAQEICEVRHIKKNLVSVHVEKLVSAGYLERSAVAGDRRKVGLSCTEKAKPIIEAGIAMQKNFIAALTNGITEEDWKTHKAMMETIEANAEAMVGGSSK